MNATLTLVLFDIDGTLLDTQGAGRQSFIRSLQHAFGWDDDIQYISFAGATDLDVLRQIADRQGVELDPDRVRDFIDVLPRELRATIGAHEMVIYPGVREILETLSDHHGVVLGLVTGNIESCAMIKLEQFDLHNHFVLGAFGHEHGDRNEIARLALERAEQAVPEGTQITATFLVGDTPADVIAAATIGATSVAVATGKHDAASLREAGADHVLDDLSDRDGVMEILGL